MLAQLYWTRQNDALRLSEPEFCCCLVVVLCVDSSGILRSSMHSPCEIFQSAATRPEDPGLRLFKTKKRWMFLFFHNFHKVCYISWNSRLDGGWDCKANRKYVAKPNSFSKSLVWPWRLFPFPPQARPVTPTMKLIWWCDLTSFTASMNASKIGAIVMALHGFMRGLLRVVQLNSCSLHALLALIEAGIPTFVNPIHTHSQHINHGHVSKKTS